MKVETAAEDHLEQQVIGVVRDPDADARVELPIGAKFRSTRGINCCC
jgi:hypothetical protein